MIAAVRPGKDLSAVIAGEQDDGIVGNALKSVNLTIPMAAVTEKFIQNLTFIHILYSIKIARHVTSPKLFPISNFTTMP
jgi:hypothetical protein